jgi:phosphoribosylformylglycinamidine cyclo-ligase
VDIGAGEEAVRRIKEAAESTFIPGVLGSIGSFAGLFEIPNDLQHPVLVTATDGVGTKVLLAQEADRLETVGIDLVAMSVNDVLTIGARPVLFLDYVAVGRLVPEEMTRVVAGVAEGCRRAGCALVGGEMAEMPGLYDPGEFDLAGFCVGLGERDKLIDGTHVREGDVVLGLASSGFHSNGYSLIRKILEVSGLGFSDTFPGSSQSIVDVLLEPTRIYVRSVLGLLEEGAALAAMAHVTGGGMVGNLSRVIPDGLTARLDLSEWGIPSLFKGVQRLGGISDREMFDTFNMGVGYVLVLPGAEAERATELLAQAGEEVFHLGLIAEGDEKVMLEGLS